MSNRTPGSLQPLTVEAGRGKIFTPNFYLFINLFVPVFKKIDELYHIHKYVSVCSRNKCAKFQFIYKSTFVCSLIHKLLFDSALEKIE